MKTMLARAGIVGSRVSHRALIDVASGRHGVPCDRFCLIRCSLVASDVGRSIFAEAPAQTSVWRGGCDLVLVGSFLFPELGPSILEPDLRGVESDARRLVRHLCFFRISRGQSRRFSGAKVCSSFTDSG